MQQAWRAALLRFDAHGQAVHDSDGLLVTQRDAAGVRRVVAAGSHATLAPQFAQVPVTHLPGRLRGGRWCGRMLRGRYGCCIMQQQARQGKQQGGFARPVGASNGRPAAAGNGYIHPLLNVCLPQAHMQALHGKSRCRLRRICRICHICRMDGMCRTHCICCIYCGLHVCARCAI